MERKTGVSLTQPELQLPAKWGAHAPPISALRSPGIVLDPSDHTLAVSIAASWGKRCWHGVPTHLEAATRRPQKPTSPYAPSSVGVCQHCTLGKFPLLSSSRLFYQPLSEREAGSHPPQTSVRLRPVLSLCLNAGKFQVFLSCGFPVV